MTHSVYAKFQVNGGIFEGAMLKKSILQQIKCIKPSDLESLKFGLEAK